MKHSSKNSVTYSFTAGNYYTSWYSTSGILSAVEGSIGFLERSASIRMDHERPLVFVVKTSTEKQG
jgi:hypothetical protein